MTTFHMNNLVTQYTSKLVCALYSLNETSVNKDGTARNCKGVQLGIFYYEEAVIKGLRPHGGKESLAYLTDVTLYLQVLDQLELAPCFAAKLPTDSHLIIFTNRFQQGHSRREIGAATVPNSQKEKKTEKSSDHARTIVKVRRRIKKEQLTAERRGNILSYIRTLRRPR